MKDSAMRRVFWMLIIGVLLFAFAWGSFVWSLGQTIRFTRLLVVDSTFGAIAGIAVQFFPTFALYMASSFNVKSEQERKERVVWLTAFWLVSGFDAITNIGARFDRASAGYLPNAGFANPEYAEILTYLLVGAGVLLDVGIVFAEEVLGHIISAFFDNLGAFLKLMFDINPPQWMLMVSSVGRAIGGKPQQQGKQRPQDGNRQNQNRPNRNNNKRGGDRRAPDRHMPRMPERRGPVRDNGDRPRSPREIPTRRDSRNNVTIMDGDEYDR